MTAALAAGAVVTLVAFVAARLGLELPGDVQSALTTLLMFGAAWTKADPPTD